MNLCSHIWNWNSLLRQTSGQSFSQSIQLACPEEGSRSHSPHQEKVEFKVLWRQTEFKEAMRDIFNADKRGVLLVGITSKTDRFYKVLEMNETRTGRDSWSAKAHRSTLPGRGWFSWWHWRGWVSAELWSCSHKLTRGKSWAPLEIMPTGEDPFVMYTVRRLCPNLRRHR